MTDRNLILLVGVFCVEDYEVVTTGIHLTQAVDQCLHLFALDLIDKAFQFFQCCVLAHVEACQSVFAAIQSSQCRILAHVETCQLVATATQICQLRVLAYVDTCQLVATAIQKCQCRILAYVETCQMGGAAVQICQLRVLAQVKERQLIAKTLQRLQFRKEFNTIQCFNVFPDYIYLLYSGNLRVGKESVAVGVDGVSSYESAEVGIGEVRLANGKASGATILIPIRSVVRMYLHARFLKNVYLLLGNHILLIGVGSISDI